MSNYISDSDIYESLKRDYASLYESIVYDPEAFGLMSKDLEGLNLMQAIRFITPETTGNELKNNVNNHVLHIPIVNERGVIVLIYSVIKTEDGLSTTLGVDFAPMLNYALQLGFSEVVLLQDEYGLYTRDVKSQNSLRMNGSEVLQSHNQEVSSSVLLNIDASDLVNTPYVVLSLNNVDSKLTELVAQHTIDSIGITKNESKAIKATDITPLYYPEISTSIVRV